MGLLDQYFDPETLDAVKSMNQPSEEDKIRARNAALGQMGFSMLANNRGMSAGQAMGNALGYGGMAFNQAYKGAMDDAREQRMQPFQTAMALKKMSRENLPSGMQMGPDGKPIWIPGYLEGQEQLRQGKQTPYYTTLSTPQGVFSFDARSGKAEPLNFGGSPVVKSSDDPGLQGRLAGAKETGKSLAEAQTQAQIGLPKAQGQAEETVRLVDDLLAHPGLNTAVGMSSKVDPRNYVPGTDAKDFQIRLDQLKGKQFLQAFETLKGGGQITEMEGRKATDAISRMNTAASETEFKKAAEEFKDAVRSGYAKLQQQANGPSAVQYPSNAGLPGVKVTQGNEQRGAILGLEMQQEQQKLYQAKASSDLKGISEANRNIQLLQKELGGNQRQSEAPKVRRYNPQTGRIE